MKCHIHILFVILSFFWCEQSLAQGSGPLLPVKQDGKWGYINQKAEIVVQPVYDAADYFSDGWAKVKADDRIIFIDQKGGVVLSRPDLAYVGSFSEGLAPARKRASSRIRYINKKGDFIIQTNFIHAFSFSEGKAAVCTEKMGSCGYINTKGNYVIKPTLDGARKFSGGLAPAKTGGFNGRWGFIDEQGSFVIQPTYE